MDIVELSAKKDSTFEGSEEELKEHLFNLQNAHYSFGADDKPFLQMDNYKLNGKIYRCLTCQSDADFFYMSPIKEVDKL